MKTAAAYLKEAIELHEGHMDGSVPTSEKSQQQLMDMIVKAYELLTMSRTEQHRANFNQRMDVQKRARNRGDTA